VFENTNSRGPFKLIIFTSSGIGKPIYDQEFFLALARRGKELWNSWRAKNPGVEGQPYISVTFEGVDFRESANGVIDFSGFEFGDYANFRACKFFEFITILESRSGQVAGTRDWNVVRRSFPAARQRRLGRSMAARGVVRRFRREFLHAPSVAATEAGVKIAYLPLFGSEWAWLATNFKR